MVRYSCQRRPTSSLYNEALLPKKISHPVAQIPLQFDAVLDRGAAGAARSLQVVSELLQEGGVAWKAVDDRDGLAAASLLFHPQFCDQARRQRFIGADAFAALAVAFGPAAAGTYPASRSGVNDSRVAPIAHAPPACHDVRRAARRIVHETVLRSSAAHAAAPGSSAS